uniref:Secreted protein n=1 Tax=Oryza meridionalis TaxID=40149 RepID=A0A0E0DJT8_9ORYZ
MEYIPWRVETALIAFCLSLSSCRSSFSTSFCSRQINRQTAGAHESSPAVTNGRVEVTTREACFVAAIRRRAWHREAGPEDASSEIEKQNARSQTDDPAIPESRVVREKTPKCSILLSQKWGRDVAGNGAKEAAAKGAGRTIVRRAAKHRRCSRLLQYASDHVVCGVIATGNSFCSGAVWMGRPCDR